MTERVFGPILSVDIDNRLIQMRVERKNQYFYLQRSLMKKFIKYLEPGNFVDLVYENKPVKIERFIAKRIDYFLKIKKKRYRKDDIFYDFKEVKDSIRKLISSKRNRMFIDLEMTLPDYKVKHTTAEIIQFGLVIEDYENGIIMEDFDYIEPKLVNGLNKKTKSFLSLNTEDFKNAISFVDFYDRIKYYLKEYNPLVYVWGKNDILALKDAYKIHKLKPLIKRGNMIDLLKLQKTYFNLKNDLGLFNTYSIYYKEENKFQSHDALEDALMTRKVFHKFLKITNEELEVSFPEGVK